MSCMLDRLTDRLSQVNNLPSTSRSDTAELASAAMNIYEIRRQQLQRLIDERFNGVTKRCAEALGMPPPQLHRWRSTTAKETRRIEWESARSIEMKLDLPQGWMDQAEGMPRSFTEGAMELSIRLVREAESESGLRFSHAEFWRLVKIVAEIANEADADMRNEDEVRFKRLIVKLFTSSDSDTSSV